MTKAEIKAELDELCENYPREAVMALYSIMGPSELFDGIPSMLEDYEQMFEEMYPDFYY